MKITENNSFSTEIIQLIQSSKQRMAVAVNAELTLLYWTIGQRIHQYVLQGERAAYGQEIIASLAKDLTAQFGRGWGQRHLNYLLQFATAFPDVEIVHALRGKLSWTHFKQLIHIEDPLKRDFYATMAAQERWSTRTLDERIGSMLFELTAISKKPEETITQELATLRDKGEYAQSMVLKDPYILDFLNLQDKTYQENQIEQAIISNLQQFLLELGKGFAFVERQKRMRFDDEDFYIDLVFYNFKLKCFLLIDLKIGKLKHQDIGQYGYLCSFI